MHIRNLMLTHKQRSHLSRRKDVLFCNLIILFFFYSFRFQKMRQFQKTLEDLGSRVASAETTITAWTPPATPSKASDEVQHLQRLRDKMTTAGALLDDCNEQQGYVVRTKR